MRNVVRNFWVTTAVDGARATRADGPRRKDGGFRVSVQMRADGRAVNALRIEGRALPASGRLMLTVENGAGAVLHRVVTQR